MVELFHSKDLEKRKEMQRILSALRWIELNKQPSITEPLNWLAVLPFTAVLLSTNETIPLIPLLQLNSRSEKSRKNIIWVSPRLCQFTMAVIYIQPR